MQPLRILAFGVLLAWGVQVLILWPMPAERAELWRQKSLEQLRELAIEEQSHPSGDNKFLAEGRFELKKYYQSIVDDPSSIESEFWIKWFRDLGMLLLGVATAIVMVRRLQLWTFGVLLTTFLYLWRQDFLVHIYGLFFREVTSIDQFYRRLEIFILRPQSFAAMVLFDLLIPFVLVLASCAAIHALFHNWRLRGIKNEC